MATASGAPVDYRPRTGYPRRRRCHPPVAGQGNTSGGGGDRPLCLGRVAKDAASFPLAEKDTHKGAGKYFLVAMKQSKRELWGIYLVDIFDNAVLLKELEGQGLVEPIPLRQSETPPQIADSWQTEQDTASVYIQNVYHGLGLAGVPEGEVKSLRIGTYSFSPHGSGGLLGTMGVDSSWDIRRILGTVPVNQDGSATFHIPANTPIFMQPLDEEGQALQNMRSWMTGMRGEKISCVGCHENANDAPAPSLTEALRQKPFEISPWQGEERPFSFRHEIQPILDANCASCHVGENAAQPSLSSEFLTDWTMRYAGSVKKAWDTGGFGGHFSVAYGELSRYVRRPGIESDMGVLTPMEFGANTTELVQMLRKGHHGVSLSQDEWQRLYCWIDFNAPYYGYRTELIADWEGGRARTLRGMARANELAQSYAGQPFFTETEVPEVAAVAAKPIPNQALLAAARKQGTLPFAAQASTDTQAPITIDLGDGQSIELVYVPAGSFVMGSGDGAMDELPMHPVQIEKGFWMATTEVTNAQMRQFAPAHHSRSEDRMGYQFGQKCYDVNGDDLPAVRLSWQQANAFCDWLAKRTGKAVRLPTEAQWEWACRAGTGTPFWYGAADADFTHFANLADYSMKAFASDTATRGTPESFNYTGFKLIENPSKYEMWIPHIEAINDLNQLQAAPGQYAPNPWGLQDMHGNVAEWTRSSYGTYPSTYSGRCQ